MGAGSLAAWVERNRAPLRLSLRITLAGLLTFAIGHLLGLPQAYWAVLTALIVSQASVGGSLKATTDRFVGSLGGAAWGVAVSLVLPHASLWSLTLTLAVAVGPLAVLTALNPAYRIAPVTAVILLLTPSSLSAGPVLSAVHRMLEIGLGSIVALGVALLVLPERAHGVLAGAAARALAGMGRLASVLVAGLAAPRDAQAAEALHAAIRKAVIAAEAAGDEAAREQRVSLSPIADPGPLCRTLRRLHNDLAMVGRASLEPLAEPARSALAAPTADAGSAIADFLRETGQAIEARRRGPSIATVEQALANYAAAVADLRRRHATQDLSDDAVGRLFGLTFALEQLRLNLRDLADRARELARPGAD